MILSRHLITEIYLSCAKFAISYRPKAKCHITARLEKDLSRDLTANYDLTVPFICLIITTDDRLHDLKRFLINRLKGKT